MRCVEGAVIDVGYVCGLTVEAIPDCENVLVSGQFVLGDLTGCTIKELCLFDFCESRPFL